MRLFLAIEIPNDGKKKLDHQLEDIKEKYPHFNWTPKENFHITLYFLGEVKDVNKVKNKIDEALFDINKFNLYAFNANIFLHNKIILHVNFRREKEMEKLVERVRSFFNDQERQKFVPHLTIARYRIPSKQQYLVLKKKLNHLDLDLNFSVSKIYLFESILSGKKPVYRKIASFRLLDH